MPKVTRYRGKNEFYQGWVARYYGSPLDPSRGEVWAEGWRMADETSVAGRAHAFAAEVRLGRNVEPVEVSGE